MSKTTIKRLPDSFKKGAYIEPGKPHIS